MTVRKRKLKEERSSQDKQPAAVEWCQLTIFYEGKDFRGKDEEREKCRSSECLFLTLKIDIKTVSLIFCSERKTKYLCI